ncbi:hypothetical protein C8R46DRAFT_1347697 [Mycena filopes]|nr:hypothetical protein C8R46DRAFT_1347697 [Mycena filopes]
MRTAKRSANADPNPTCEHFELNRPVEKQLIISRRCQEKRAGRAICRIVYPHGVTIETIARISVVSEETVRRAIRNEQGDNVAKDYYYAHLVDQTYMKNYPPFRSYASYTSATTTTRRQTRKAVPRASGGKDVSAGHLKPERVPSEAREDSEHSVEKMKTQKSEMAMGQVIDLSEDTPPPNTLVEEKKSPISRPKEEPNQESQVYQWPAPPGRGGSCTSQSTVNDTEMEQEIIQEPLLMHQFLLDVGGFDLSSWEAEFQAKGISSMSHVVTIAKWPEDKLVKSLSKLFPDMSEINDSP